MDRTYQHRAAERADLNNDAIDVVEVVREGVVVVAVVRPEALRWIASGAMVHQRRNALAAKPRHSEA